MNSANTSLPTRKLSFSDVIIPFKDLHPIIGGLRKSHAGIERLNQIMTDAIHEDSSIEFIEELDSEPVRLVLHDSIEILTKQAIDLQKELFNLMQSNRAVESGYCALVPLEVNENGEVAS